MSTSQRARATADIEAAEQQSFYISATGAPARPRRSLKHDDTFAVIDSHGDMGSSSGGLDGLFDKDTRYLSRLELLLNGTHPLLLGSNLRDDNALLTTDLTNPDIYFENRLVLQKDTVHVVRTIFLWRGIAYQRLGIRNHGNQHLRMHLTLSFGNDFADVFEVRGLRRQRRGKSEITIDGATATLDYLGIDHVRRRTRLSFDPMPTRLDRGLGAYALELAPGGRTSLFLTVECNADDASARPKAFFRGMHSAFRERKAAAQCATTIRTSNQLFNKVLCRSVADLSMLTTRTAEGPYPYAGIPWYSTTFGRDGLITALQMLWCDPGIALGVLRRLAAYQSHGNDSAADSEPGKILHEMRGGEMAALREVPFGLYYGSVDATPLFVVLAGQYFERTGDIETLHLLWPHIVAALKWIDGPGDTDGDGFVEYHRATEQGLANQGWKDSQDAIFHADGSLAEGPIALVEVQGYVYAAKRLAARCAGVLGHAVIARALDEQASILAARFDDAFWCPEIGTYALALDGEKRRCAVRTSNAGHVLFSGIARPERALMIAEQLLRPSFYSGWGIRTLGSDEPRYNPMSYHNGSIWPHDNALIALGFARYGQKRAVERVFTGLFESATYMDFHRLPELFCGFRRTRSQGPTLYPVACSPQAWSCVTPFALISACLGLEFEPATREIRLRNPRLPAFLNEIVLSDLRLGETTVDMSVRRQGKDISMQLIRSQGEVRVSALYS
jgi:glycogen debranching enzyme